MSGTIIRSHANPPPASTVGPILPAVIADDRTSDQMTLDRVERIAILKIFKLVDKIHDLDPKQA